MAISAAETSKRVGRELLGKKAGNGEAGDETIVPPTPMNPKMRRA